MLFLLLGGCWGVVVFIFVIPKILKVLEPANKPDLPEGKWKWNNTKVDIITEENLKEIEIFYVSYMKHLQAKSK